MKRKIITGKLIPDDCLHLLTTNYYFYHITLLIERRKVNPYHRSGRVFAQDHEKVNKKPFQLEVLVTLRHLQVSYKRIV